MMTRLLFLLACGSLFAVTPTFETVEIDKSVEIGYGLAIGDVDGDSKADIILADKKVFRWYRNPDWKAFTLAENLTARDNVCIAARDIDGDGKVEIAVGGQWNPRETSSEDDSGSVHLLLRPDDPTQLWKAVKLAHEPTVHRMRWLRHGNGSASLVVAPLHGSDNNWAGTGENGAKVLAYDVPKNAAAWATPAAWKTRVLCDRLHKTHNFDVVASHGGESVLVGGHEGLFRTRSSGRLEKSLLIDPHQEGAEKFAGAGEVRNGPNYSWRGRSLTHITTIEPMHGNELVVYRARNGRDGRDGWERSVIDDSLAQGHALACADILGTGREQIIAGWRKPNAAKKTGINIYVADAQGAWQRHVVDNGNMVTEDLRVGDIDGDGRLDIVAAGRASKNLKIYFNRSEIGKPPVAETSWRKHEVWSGGRSNGAVAADFTGDGKLDIGFNAAGKSHLLTGPDWTHQVISPPDTVGGGIHCAAMDVDRDGDIDFIDCPRQLSWLENPGGASNKPWSYHLVDKDPTGIHCVLPADVNQDGKQDLIVNQFNPLGAVGDSIMWYETSGGDWTRHVFASGDAGGGSHYMGFGDLDGDKLPDIVAAAKGPPFGGGHWYAWWKNPGAAAITKPWSKTVVAENEWCATNVLPVDVDGDGDNDLIATHGHECGTYWFENSAGDASVWKRHVIDRFIANPHCLVTADFDQDGDIDAATCGYGDRSTVWYENDGRGSFTTHDIDHDQQAYDIRAADLDGDGDLDILLAGQGSNNVVWYANPLK
jgi:hypothetical protein